MPLPINFSYTQTNLQDYLDCPRRFELRHILHQEWPALESEPVLEHEQFIEQGILFHQRIHQLISGIPQQHLVDSQLSTDFQRWWQNFVICNPLKDLPARLYPEYTLTAHLGTHKVSAKFDLLAIDPGKAFIILDWKTSQKRTPASVLTTRVQSRLYPILLVKAGSHLNNLQRIPPHQVNMQYWFADYPSSPEIIIYSQEKYDSDLQFLQQIMQEIENLPAGQFQITHDEKRCRYCQYRSLCRRGVTAGYQDDLEDNTNLEMPLEVDFEHLGEIPF